jgi:hypothetical protein
LESTFRAISHSGSFLTGPAAKCAHGHERNGPAAIGRADERANAPGHHVDDLARGLHRQIAVPVEVRRIASVVHEQARAAGKSAFR